MPDPKRTQKKPGPKPVDWKPAFLKALRATGGVVQAACDAVGIVRGTAYSARQTDSDFALEWESSKEAAIDDAEAHLLDLAMGRLEEGVWFKGERVGAERIISETALLAFLAARRPETWGRKVQITSGDGAPLPVVGGHEKLSVSDHVDIARVTGVREETVRAGDGCSRDPGVRGEARR
jgi:hypothetical protein